MEGDGFRIKGLNARWILDSRGNPTLEVDVYLNSGAMGRASVPSGASRGRYEALEVRDGGKPFHGKGVSKAIVNIREKVAPSIKGMNALKQSEIDWKMIELDGTENKSRLGANSILAVSLAVCRAAAEALKKPLYIYIHELFHGYRGEKYILPLPLSNVFNAGKHGGGGLEIQEFMVAPVGAETFKEALRWTCEVYQTLRDQLVKRYGPLARNVGDEGGFSAPVKKVREVLDGLTVSIEESGYLLKKDFMLAIDAAASEFYKHGKYSVESRELSLSELTDFYVELINEYPIFSLEDPFDQDDWDGFVEITKRIGGRVQIVGDDHLVTNVKRLRKSIERKSCNSLLLKVNQVGTLTEAMEAARLALNNNYSIIVSHRSGETEDSFISDLAVGLGTGQIKAGAPSRGERTAKYNRLLRIEETIEKPVFAGFTEKNR